MAGKFGMTRVLKYIIFKPIVDSLDWALYWIDFELRRQVRKAWQGQQMNWDLFMFLIHQRVMIKIIIRAFRRATN